MIDYSVDYVKEVGAKKVTITIESKTEALGMLDILRALSAVVSNILNTGKY